MPVPVGIYARIPDDAADDAKGVARQKHDCPALARVRRWEPTVYEDNDISAYRKGVVREAFGGMLDDLRAGLVKGIVADNIDRGFRGRGHRRRTGPGLRCLAPGGGGR